MYLLYKNVLFTCISSLQNRIHFITKGKRTSKGKKKSFEIDLFVSNSLPKYIGLYDVILKSNNKLS